MKKVDINNIIKQLTGPNSTQDMMTFFEGLPSKAGKTLLVAGGVAWMVAGVAILYGSIQSDQIAQMRIDLAQTEALTPPVPTVKNINVDQGQIEYFVARAAESLFQVIQAVNTARFVRQLAIYKMAVMAGVYQLNSFV